MEALNQMFKSMVDESRLETTDDERLEEVQNRLEESLGNLDSTKLYRLKITDTNGSVSWLTINQRNINQLIDRIYGEGINEEETAGSDKIAQLSFSSIAGVEIEPFTSTTSRRNNDGGYFPFLNLTAINLTEFQIGTKEQVNKLELFKDHCLVHAFKEQGMDELTLNTLKTYIKQSLNVPKRNLKEIAELLRIKIYLYELDSDNKQDVKIYNKTSTGKTYRLGLFMSHYFVYKVVNFHRYLITHYDDIKNHPKRMYMFKKNEYKSDYSLNSLSAISLMFKAGFFTPIKFEDMNNPSSQLGFSLNNNYKEVALVLEQDCQLGSEPQPKDNQEISKFKTIGFADFETHLDKQSEDTKHHFDMIAYKEIQVLEDGSLTDSETEIYYNIKQWLKRVRHGSLIYFHNLKYDFNILTDHVKIIKSIEKDGKIYSMKCIINYTPDGKPIMVTFRDSYKLISSPLKQFPEMFNLESKKEIMPYDLYTTETCSKMFISIKEAEKYLSPDDFEELKQKITELNLWSSRRQTMFYHMKYRSYYCKTDVEVLSQGMRKFREYIQTIVGVDVFNFMSISSIGQEFMVREGCFEGVYSLGGTVRNFVQQSIVGGRTMTRGNRTWHIKKKISDFDGVSLYPSAMNRLDGYPKGRPKILDVSKDDLNDFDHYVVEIKITRCPKVFDMPMFSYVNKQGKRVWENKVPDGPIILDKIMLEDCMKYHKISFDIIRGVYWNEGINNKVNFAIKKLFQARLDAKAVKNPIQNIYKLLMNSCYGKTCLKDSDHEVVYLKDQTAFDNYFYKNYNLIKDAEKLSNKQYRVKLLKSVYTHENFAHCGGIILSEAKRIMNEVQFAAKSIKVPIYYQDTDSMHIETDSIPKLALKYKEIFNRELIGSNLGQFHSDFSLKGSVTEPVAVETVLIAPKTYCDRLEGKNSKGETIEGWHYRLKGVSNKSIINECQKNFDGNYVNMYLSGRTIEFDLLCDNQIKFEYISSGGVKSKLEFKRKVNFFKIDNVVS